MVPENDRGNAAVIVADGPIINRENQSIKSSDHSHYSAIQ
jgi:hypothetical protein